MSKREVKAEREGGEAEMANSRMGLILMPSPAALPWAYCSTVPIGDGREAIGADGSQGSTPWPSHAPLNREQGESMRS